MKKRIKAFEAKFQGRDANAIPPLGVGFVSTGVVCWGGGQRCQTLGTGDNGHQAFKEKSLITITGLENIPVYHCKLVDIFTNRINIQSHVSQRS